MRLSKYRDGVRHGAILRLNLIGIGKAKVFALFRLAKHRLKGRRIQQRLSPCLQLIGIGMAQLLIDPIRQVWAEPALKLAAQQSAFALLATLLQALLFPLRGPIGGGVGGKHVADLLCVVQFARIQVGQMAAQADPVCPSDEGAA